MLADFIEQFKKLRVDLAHPPPKVHKPCMLLTVIDLAERGVISDNEIRYEDTLEGFAEYAEAVRPGENLEACLPFLHLKTAPFWTVKCNGEALDDDIRARHRSMIGTTASLTPELHKHMTAGSPARAEIREALVSHWFPESRANVEAVVAARMLANEYENKLRGGKAAPDQPKPDNNARKQSFRRLVLEAYDYRCAATGWRIIVPPVGPLVDAAHLIPFNATHDDRPSNGIALTPTFHRALDRHLIAPGPNMKWRISKGIDRRIPDNRLFTDLEGQPVIFEGKRQFHPAPDALRWRADHLLKP